jgi:hypothetical protein
VYECGYWIYDLIYWTFTPRDYTLQIAITQTSVLSPSSLPLLGNGFQRRTFSFLWVSEQSPASATSFSQQRLTTTEPQLLSELTATVWVWVTLRLTVCQSVCLGIEPRTGLMTRYLLLFDNFCFVFGEGRPLWREGGSVFCQSLSAVISQLSVCTVIYI